MGSFGASCRLLQIFERFGRFWVDFGPVLGSHVGAILEPKTDENGKKSRFPPFFRASRRKAVTEAVALCAATVAPPDAEDVLVKWTGLGYDEASRERWSDVLEACADREDLDARVVACARRFASKPTRTQASARAAQDKASVKAVKRAVPLAPYRGGPLHLRPYQIDGVAWLAFNYLQKRCRRSVCRIFTRPRRRDAVDAYPSRAGPLY